MPKRNFIVIWFAETAFHRCPGLQVGCTGFTSKDGVKQSAQRRHVRTSKQSLKLYRPPTFFQGIVSAEDVHTGKPDPEVYLMAAARVGTSPDRCIVVEDSVAGVEGARRAGMRSIGVSHNGNHLTADVVVQSLDLLDSDAFEKLLQKA